MPIAATVTGGNLLLINTNANPNFREEISYPGGSVHSALFVDNVANTSKLVLCFNGRQVFALGSAEGVEGFGNTFAGGTNPSAAALLAQVQLGSSASNTPTVLTTTLVSSIDFTDIQLPAQSKVKTLLFNNFNNAAVFLQAHSKATALTTGNGPYAQWSVRVPPNSTLLLGSADFGDSGRQFGGAPRFGVSSTAAAFTAVVNPSNMISIETVA